MKQILDRIKILVCSKDPSMVSTLVRQSLDYSRRDCEIVPEQNTAILSETLSILSTGCFLRIKGITLSPQRQIFLRQIVFPFGSFTGSDASRVGLTILCHDKKAGQSFQRIFFQDVHFVNALQATICGALINKANK